MADDSVCSRCGAMLPLPDLAGFSTCLHCGHATRREPAEIAAEQDADRKATAGQTTVSVTFSAGTDATTTFDSGAKAYAQAAQKKRSKRGAGAAVGVFGCLVPILIVSGIVAAVIFGLTKAETGPFSNRSDLFPSSGSALVLPGEASGSDDVVLVANDNSGGDTERVLVRVRLGADGGDEVWKSDPLPGDVYTAPLATDGEHLYAAVGDEVWNLDLETGEQVWRATVSDRIGTSCRSCFTVVAGTLVVRTDDATVVGFLPGSAEPRWTRRLTSPSGSVSAVGDWVVVVDDGETAGDPTQAITIDPRTGNVQKVVIPGCPESEVLPFGVELSSSDTVLAVPGTTDAVARFGHGYGCIARWELTSGTPRWSVELTSGEAFTDPEPLLTATDLVETLADGSLLHVDLATGRNRAMDPLPDRESAPRAIIDGTLLAETTTTRGTTRGGLAAWDVATGQRRWDLPLPDGAQPFDTSYDATAAALFDGQSRTLLVTTTATPQLLTFEGKGHTVRQQGLDVATGELGEARTRTFPTRYDSSTPSVSIDAVDGRRVLFSVDSVLDRLPLDGTSKITRWPS